jgi:hypothetical protein
MLWYCNFHSFNLISISVLQLFEFELLSSKQIEDTDHSFGTLQSWVPTDWHVHKQTQTKIELTSIKWIHHSKNVNKWSLIVWRNWKVFRLFRIVNNTQSRSFKWRVNVEEVFEIDREGERERFAPFKKLPHHRLLWHGSRYKIQWLLKNVSLTWQFVDHHHHQQQQLSDQIISPRLKNRSSRSTS